MLDRHPDGFINWQIDKETCSSPTSDASPEALSKTSSK